MTCTYDIINREDAGAAFELTSPPILVVTIDYLDDVTLLERQFPGF